MTTDVENKANRLTVQYAVICHRSCHAIFHISYFMHHLIVMLCFLCHVMSCDATGVIILRSHHSPTAAGSRLWPHWSQWCGQVNPAPQDLLRHSSWLPATSKSGPSDASACSVVLFCSGLCLLRSVLSFYTQQYHKTLRLCCGAVVLLYCCDVYAIILQSSVN